MQGRVSLGRTLGSRAEGLFAASVYTTDGLSPIYFPEFDAADTGHGKVWNADGDRTARMFGDVTIGRWVFRGAYGSRTKHVPTASFGTTFGDTRERTVDTRGLLEAKYTATGVFARLSQVYAKAEDASARRSLSNSPRHASKYQLGVPLGQLPLQLGVQGSYLSTRVSVSGEQIPGVYLQSATLTSTHLSEHAEFSVGVCNVFDAQYGDPGSEEHVQTAIPPEGTSRRREQACRLSRSSGHCRPTNSAKCLRSRCGRPRKAQKRRENASILLSRLSNQERRPDPPAMSPTPTGDDRLTAR